MRNFYLFAFVIILITVIGPFSKAYTQIGLTVNVTFNNDGSAHVTERYSLLLDNDTETETFQNYVEFGQNTIIEWRQFLKDLNYHLSGPSTPQNTKISASRLLQIGARSAQIDLDYDLPTTATLKTKLKSRLTEYSFNQSYLNFVRSTDGQTVLPSGTTIIFNAPVNSVIESDGYYPSPAKISQISLAWVGPITAKWRFSYTVEESLSDEVASYFDSLYSNMFQMIPYILPIALALLILGFGYDKLVRTKPKEKQS